MKRLIVALCLLAAVIMVAVPPAGYAYPGNAQEACLLCRYNPMFCSICIYMVYWEAGGDCYPTDWDCV